MAGHHAQGHLSRATSPAHPDTSRQLHCQDEVTGDPNPHGQHKNLPAASAGDPAPAPGTLPGDTPSPRDSAWGHSETWGQCLGNLQAPGTVPGNAPTLRDTAWGPSKPRGQCLGMLQAPGTLPGDSPSPGHPPLPQAGQKSHKQQRWRWVSNTAVYLDVQIP